MVKIQGPKIYEHMNGALEEDFTSNKNLMKNCWSSLP